MIVITFALQNKKIIGVCTGSGEGIGEIHSGFPWFRKIINLNDGPIEYQELTFEKKSDFENQSIIPAWINYSVPSRLGLTDGKEYYFRMGRAYKFINAIAQTFDLDCEGLGGEYFGGGPFSKGYDPEELLSWPTLEECEKLPAWKDLCSCSDPKPNFDGKHNKECSFNKLAKKFLAGDEKAAITLAQYFKGKKKDDFRWGAHFTDGTAPNLQCCMRGCQEKGPARFSCINCMLDHTAYACPTCLTRMGRFPKFQNEFDFLCQKCRQQQVIEFEKDAAGVPCSK